MGARNIPYHAFQLDRPGAAFIIKDIHHLIQRSGDMNGCNDVAVQRTGSAFSFRALLAALWQLRLRDKLSATNRDDGGIHWGM